MSWEHGRITSVRYLALVTDVEERLVEMHHQLRAEQDACVELDHSEHENTVLLQVVGDELLDLLLVF